ncbi:MAG: cytochrome c oxidase, cbb3-type, CcoQ subunit [Sulfuricurvum sp.]|uniref:cytochrome c oxidase, cbb3-type, CcoQ subunit n=1 Tax=Sulfuricurvum sp. TaxID=2025608 RepID=UPI0026331DEF|nr:cytochrome c oxidase, cbb3-type, CcoQ subunit [Sulfuricurvum sp.]MDD2828027.1 cytochrome c oxidase, cbb3-type, CcoQ subunit [Sulfuricurvum sp.]MDD4948096.1 cytochrome c oxidase, cbb3-type, CcoQ subunit [Sulfuricurvum sp.]
MDIATLQAYGYFFFTAFLVAVLYGYIYHLYSSQKKGERDYEKYGNLALNDEITDQPIEEISKNDETKK